MTLVIITLVLMHESINQSIKTVIYSYYKSLIHSFSTLICFYDCLENLSETWLTNQCIK